VLMTSATKGIGAAVVARLAQGGTRLAVARSRSDSTRGRLVAVALWRSAGRDRPLADGQVVCHSRPRSCQRRSFGKTGIKDARDSDEIPSCASHSFSNHVEPEPTKVLMDIAVRMQARRSFGMA
jgi:NAD(P)-dependent dehydrogenase (short-subunit alcohol dehydrogenase family)